MKKQNGFTLLEMLVVLTVFALLMVTLTEGMRFSGRASRMAAQTLAWSNQIEPADRALRRMIEQTRPRQLLEADPALVGDTQTMSFRTELSDPSLALGLGQARVVLRLDDAHDLVAQTQPAPHANWIGAPPPLRETLLVKGLATIEFAYWDGAKWLSSWPAQGDDLPRLVRIRLRFAPGDSRRWPDIIASPMREPLP